MGNAPQPGSAEESAGEVLRQLVDEIVGLRAKLGENMAMLTEIRETVVLNSNDLQSLQQKTIPAVLHLEVELEKLRSVSLGKIDGLLGTIDLVREDIRVNWATADFAISNSRHGRADVDKLILMVTTMQGQQQTLMSQVDELRKAAQERDAGLK